MMRRFLVCALLVTLHLTITSVRAEEIDYLEDFSLAPDRTVALEQLVPGTEDYYYYHCLHLQNTEQFEAVEELLKTWIARYKTTNGVRQIRYRQALLTYDRDPAASLQYLRKELDLKFNHQRNAANQQRRLPTRFPEQLITRQTLLDRAFARHLNLQGLEDSALAWLAGGDLNTARRRHLLQRLQRPDFPNLARLVVADLKTKGFPGFGAYDVHKQMLLEQLNQCVQFHPPLLDQANFVNIYMSKLLPSDDIRWAEDRLEHRAYLDRLWEFVNRLAPVHNSLKAHVLYRRLVLDRSMGIYDEQRFMTYIQLPRNTVYVNPEFIKDHNSRRYLINMQANYTPVTRLPIIGNDEPLVRSYLSHFFVEAADFKQYEPFLRDGYLKELFAETKIVHGIGDPDQWSAMISPARFQALKDRVDLDFSFTNQEYFDGGADVSLDIHVKNVDTLIVKVYELNAQNYYRQELQQVSTGIKLDGLVANMERTVKYEEAPLRRAERHFDFPELNRPGVFVIDFIGNGKSSRTLVRKGKLDFLVETTTAGHRFTVLGEEKHPVEEASIWISGTLYEAGEDGTIVVPFSTNPGMVPFVVTDGSTTTLHRFQHEAEQYQMTAGIYVDREALLERQLAPVIIRPALSLNGTPVTLSVLEDVRLTISSVDHDGIRVTSRVDDFELHEGEETVHEFRVPQRLQTIQFLLTARVKSLSQGKPVDLVVAESFDVNQIERTEKTADVFLAWIDGNYVLDLLGKTGELRPGRPVQVTLKHRDFRDPISLQLQADDLGRIQLGALKDIVNIQVRDVAGSEHSWPILQDQHSYYGSQHARTGDVIAIPYMGSKTQADRQDLSLLALRGTTYVSDHFDSLAVEDGMILLRDLAVGDYDLLIRSAGRRIRVRVTEADGEQQGYLLGARRHLEVRGEQPLQVTSITAGKEQLAIQLRGWNDFARVHVLATRYYPAFSVAEKLGGVRDAEPYAVSTTRPRTLYVEGRDIGDEYRYIIDRKYAQKFPGNMLRRPELLLNPWPIRTTETDKQQAQGGNEFAAKIEESDSAASRGGMEDGEGVANGDFSRLDFLAEGSTLLANLVPNEEGTLLVDRDALGAHQHIHIVVVDPTQTVYRSVSLPEKQGSLLDLRLIKGLDPNGHFVQQKQISLVKAQQPFTIQDVTTGRFETFNSLERVYQLFATLNNDVHLKEFHFLLGWPELEEEQKLEHYSKHACHELNFFLYRKDRDFFDNVIRPYLANKQHKTFLDHWLVEMPLEEYLKPWNYRQLNVVERILLGQRLAAERVASRRHVDDLFDLVPPNIDRYNQLFETALSRSGLSAESAQQELIDEVTASRRLKSTVAEGGAPANRPETRSATAGSDRAREREPLSRQQQAADQDRKTADKRNLRLEEEEKSKLGLLKDSPATNGRANGKYRKSMGYGHAGAAKEYFSANGIFMSQVRQLYREQEKTREWVENNYYKLPIASQNADRVTVNGFWNDLAAHEDGSFHSRNLTEATGNFTEMMFALAVLDLPFVAGEQDLALDETRLRMVNDGPAIVFHEEVKEVEAADQQAPILVSQNFFRHGDRYIHVDNEQRDKFVSREFLVHTVYGCQVVITNPTSSRQKLDVLLQVPIGALPVLGGRATRSVHMELEGFHTQTLEYYFYFPAAGEYAHFPAHVSGNETLLAHAMPFTFNVVDSLTEVDTNSWAYVSQNGTNQQVIDYLDNHNVHRLDLAKITFRMSDKEFFRQITRLLSKRHAYHHTLWSYAMLHDVPEQINQFLQHADNLVNQCGSYLQSPILVIDPVIRRIYEHMEYRPLVNARAHQLGAKRQILNDRFYGQYHRLLRVLSYKRKLSDEDMMAVTYYLLLQDRMVEALAMFEAVNPDALVTRLQYDYFSAYLAFSRGNARLARSIAVAYADHPVAHWNAMFTNIVNQADEIRGDGVEVADDDDQVQAQDQLADSQPSFDFNVESGEVTIDFQNLENVQVNYYEIDIELLFSRSPFVQEFSGGFSYIRPNRSETIQLPGRGGTHQFKLPQELSRSNVLVEIVGGGQTQTRAYYSHALSVQVVQNYGQVRVLHAETRKPLAAVYVKVYAQMRDGSVKFYKDGYTDLRGRFDYASVSTGDLENVLKYGLLIASDKDGAMVREATPPLR